MTVDTARLRAIAKGYEGMGGLTMVVDGRTVPTGIRLRLDVLLSLLDAYDGARQVHVLLSLLDAYDGARQVLAHTEQEYAHVSRALTARGGNEADLHRWEGHAERLRDTATRLRAALGEPPVDYRSPEWRAENGVQP